MVACMSSCSAVSVSSQLDYYSPEPVSSETIGVVGFDIDLNPFAILAELMEDADECDAVSVLPY